MIWKGFADRKVTEFVVRDYIKEKILPKTFLLLGQFYKEYD
jgi:hypothetical protein